MNKQRPLPPIIYKYFRINENLYQLLINNQLWFSYPGDFNDPYDCYFNFSKEITVQEAIDFMKRNFAKGDAMLDEIDYTSEVIQRSPDLIKEQLIKPLQKFITTASLCCFSANPKSLLMWSHYADSHKGLCLGFDTIKLQETFSKIFWVKYKIKLPELELLKVPLDTIFDILANKSNQWQYEKEIRILGETKGNSAFMKEAVKEVIFGLRTTDEQRKTIVKLLGDCKYKANCKKAIFSEENYEVKFVNFVLANPFQK